MAPRWQLVVPLLVLLRKNNVTLPCAILYNHGNQHQGTQISYALHIHLPTSLKARSYFDKHQQWISDCMTMIPCQVGRIDPTVKSVCNVGYANTNTGHQITQYTSLFCVLNLEGWVAKRLCQPQTNYHRATAGWVERPTCPVDSLHGSGQDRTMLQRIFGRNVSMCLGTFHLKQHLTCALLKHPRKLA